MTRGRKRKHNPAIPGHIDQAAIPRGFYFERGRWYLFDPRPDGGTKKLTVADATARLSDLHAIAEQRAGGGVVGTLGHLVGLFEKSSEFAGLAGATQRDYRYHGKLLTEYVLRSGMPLGTVQVGRLDTPAIQRLIERLASPGPADADGRPTPGRPSTANHCLRYLRRLFAWGIRFGRCLANPAKGVKQAREKKAAKMPERDVFALLLEFARERGARKAHSAGSAPPYLAPAMVLAHAHAVRLRGIEVTTLTDAHALEQGILSNRRKGSRDNITRWEPALREAWDQLVEVRRKAMNPSEGKPGKTRLTRPTQLRPEDRFLMVNQSGTPLEKSSLDSAWQRLMVLAVKEGLITRVERFTLHGLKHRGITDTAGTVADKQQASGNKSQDITHRYNHEKPLVQPARAIGNDD
ncbi:site-specific integrase [Pseudoxanthomonas winnipegensis]|uniref:Integrase n=1 Tax=Pseudoxanthomonas winnipegensis TaxID=2480810 RepID=A0A4Q8M3D7_9GAMM|nr:integrase [Pseudoxanthomonas winnipegensis]TAA42542.1 integrase [Pseudoxanthomonas winnipegensis]